MATKQKKPLVTLLIRLLWLLTACLLLSTSWVLAESPAQYLDNNDGFYSPDRNQVCGNVPVASTSNNLPNTVPDDYYKLFTNASAAYQINPQYLAAIFLTENGNQWKPFNGPWPTSSAGASGPFQFMPGTWDGYKVDGNNDGKLDVNDITDASYSAAHMLSANGVTTTTPLGSLDKPFTPGTMLYISAVYNWGGGNVSMHTNPNSPLSVAPKETQDYLSNVYTLVTSGFTKSGKSTYPDPSPPANTNLATTVAASTSSQPTVVVLDPGHAGANTIETDPTSGIVTADSGGAPGEMQNMWDTAQIIKAKLEKDGYKVVLTKNSENDIAGLLTKANRANQTGAAIAVSLHYTDGVNFGTTSQHWGVTPQEAGRFRQNKSDGKRKTFEDATLAQKSLQYAQIIAQERDKTGDNANVAPLDQSFPQDRPDVQAWGDISMVQLFGTIPWVYNETGAVGFDKQKYADGIANGIEKAVPATGAITSGGSSTSCSNMAGGGIIGTALNYAWSDGRNTPDQKPSYQQAVATASAANKYVGGGSPIGDDCGGFVTRVMQDSGADPNYGGGGNTFSQEKYLDSHPDKYVEIHPHSTADLQPGDIAISNSGKEHTYMYVGKQNGFATTIASASIEHRAPTAGKEMPADPSYRWFRMIK